MMRDAWWLSSFSAVAILLATVVAGGVVAVSQSTGDEASSATPLDWAAVWDGERAVRPDAPLWTHADVEREARRLGREAPGLITVDEIGASVEGRALFHLRTGRGPFAVLLWSQMHGDEPSATPALFDVLDYLARHRDEPRARRLLDRLTLHLVPMLNPDGAQRFERRNAQGIDINRDALRLQTPEGRALKALRDRHEPRLGFNLHNQNWRTSVGRPPRPATISLLSVAFDDARSDSDGRRLTRHVGSVIRDALEPFASGRIGRYDDEFEVRAFGDNVTRWGTPVVLIESGAWPGPEPDRMLTRLNFIAIMAALEAVATGRVHDADAARYESLPVNEERMLHTVVTNATIEAATGVPPFLGDVGIGVSRVVRSDGGTRRVEWVGRIEDVGDLRTYGAVETIDATGRWLAPADPGVESGQERALPSPRDRGAGPVILPGQPAAVAILSPTGRPGRYHVDRVIRFADPRR